MTTLFWFVLLVAGELAMLKIVDAGHALHYQHYLPPGRFWATSPVASCVIALQLSIVLAAVIRKGKDIQSWLSEHFSALQIAVVMAVFAIGSTVPSCSTPGYLSELVLATGIQLLNLSTVVLMAASIPEHRLVVWVRRVR